MRYVILFVNPLKVKHL